MNIEVFFTRKVHIIVIGMHLIRELLKCFQTRCDAVVMACEFHVRVRETHAFSSRVACDCALYSPLLCSASCRLGPFTLQTLFQNMYFAVTIFRI